MRINTTIFIALILYTLFVFFFFLIYIINFVFLIDCCFKDACLTFVLIVIYTTNNRFCTIFVYIFVSCVSFSTFFIFFSRFVVFFNLFNIKIISICLFFAKSLLNLRVSFLTTLNYLINIIIETISNAFFFLDL